MSRRRAAKKREVISDAKFGNLVVAKLINYMMVDGKKSIAEKALYVALEKFSASLSVDPMEGLDAVVNNVRPLVEVRSRRVGGATYQVPCDIRPKRALALALRWLISAARSRKDRKTISERLAAELIDAYSSKGEAVKKRENTHKMAEANRAYAHYNW